MDDGYEGSSSGETSESSVETGSDAGTVDGGEVGSITEAETADAFDEGSEGSVEPDPEASVSAESETEKSDTLDAPVSSGKADISESEISEAFDEEAPAKADAPVPPEAKPELTTDKAGTSTSKAETKPPESNRAPDSGETVHVNCTREDLAGKEHPETGVPYETKVVEVNGRKLEVTVPKFESNYDFKLDSNQLQLDRQKHNDICNAKLKEHCEQNPDWANETFSQKQLDQIKSGKKPEGYTWHHDGGEVGHMQLVDSKVHHDTRHTGGIAIWGNKSKYT